MDFNQLLAKMRDLDQPTTEACGDAPMPMSMPPSVTSQPPPTHPAGSAHPGVGLQLAGDEAGGDGLSAAGVSRAVHVAGAAGDGAVHRGAAAFVCGAACALARAVLAGRDQFAGVAGADHGGAGQLEQRAGGHLGLQHAYFFGAAECDV